jgi:hypothetical protein
MKTTKISLDTLFAPKSRALSPRDQLRMEQETAVAAIIKQLQADPSKAIKIEAEGAEKLSTIRSRFYDLKPKLNAADVQLLSRDGVMYAYRKTQ